MSELKQRTLDFLELEWGTYVERFNRWDEEEKEKRIRDSGYLHFRDMLAHVLAWWEEGARIVTGILYEPGFTWVDPEADAFNVELTSKYGSWSFDDLLKHYEAVRLSLIDLVKKIPDDAFLNKDIESWLASDVVWHYDGHAG